MKYCYLFSLFFGISLFTMQEKEDDEKKNRREEEIHKTVCINFCQGILDNYSNNDISISRVSTHNSISSTAVFFTVPIPKFNLFNCLFFKKNINILAENFSERIDHYYGNEMGMAYAHFDYLEASKDFLGENVKKIRYDIIFDVKSILAAKLVNKVMSNPQIKSNTYYKIEKLICLEEIKEYIDPKIGCTTEYIKGEEEYIGLAKEKKFFFLHNCVMTICYIIPIGLFLTALIIYYINNINDFLVSFKEKN